MEKSNLPVKIESKSLINKVKKGGVKAFKILGSGAISLGFIGAIGASMIYSPILIIPSIIGATFSVQKFLNNTVYKSFKDLAFIARSGKNSIKIVQDLTRLDLTKRIKGLSNIEKLAFMQLQMLVGLSKVKAINKSGENLFYETLSHSVNQKTFRKLQDLGYIKDYSESFNKNSAFLMLQSKLAFGNFKDLLKKEKFYNIKFKITDKNINFEDETLRRNFPAIFSQRRGIIAKMGMNFSTDENGAIVIDYDAKRPYINAKEKNEIRNLQKRQQKDFRKEIRIDAPTLKEQRDYIKGIEQKQRYNSQEKDEKIR